MKKLKPEQVKKYKVDQKEELFPFLERMMPGKSRDNIKSLLRHKLVLVDGQSQSHVRFELQAGQMVSVGRKGDSAPAIPGVKILFEDPHLLVAIKPAGLLTVSTENEKHRTLFRFLSSHIKKQDENNRLFIVHRLDRETSGVLVFARSEMIKRKLQQSWNDEVIERKYVAQVEGRVEGKNRTIISYLRESKAMKMHVSRNQNEGQRAVTHLKVLEVRKNTSIVELDLETGRKNQIRVQMQEIGHPVLGDSKYGSIVKREGRIALHAKSLSFIHPVTKETLRFETEVPREVLK